MQGDYHRYLAEIHVKGEKEEAQKSYEKATKDAAELPSTNSIRLGLALNYSGKAYGRAYSGLCVLACVLYD